MKRKRFLLGTVLVLGAAVAVALAQPGEQGGAPGGGGGAGGPGMPGMGGGPGMMGGPFMGMRGGPPGSVAVTATDKYLFIVRGNTVFQLDVNTLEILKQKELPEPERGGPDRQGMGGGARQRPPMEGGAAGAGGDKRQ